MSGKYLPSDDPDTVRAGRRDSTCSFYQPPPASDIDKMRSNMIKEQKVFLLIREIVGKNPTLICSRIEANMDVHAKGLFLQPI